MGFSFRKSKKIGPFRFNLNSRGGSVSLGVKGARINLSSTRGATASVGVGGMRYQTRLGGRAGAAPKAWDVPQLSVGQPTPEAPRAFERDEAETARIYDEAYARHSLHQARATKALKWMLGSMAALFLTMWIVSGTARPWLLALPTLGLIGSALALLVFSGLAGQCRYGHPEARYNVRSGFENIRRLHKVLQRAGATSTTFVHLIDVEEVAWYRVRLVKKLPLRFLNDLMGARVVFAPGHVFVAHGERVIDMCAYSEMGFSSSDHYEYETKDGSPDRRYGYNPTFTSAVFVIGSHTAVVRLDDAAPEFVAMMQALRVSGSDVV